MLRLVVACASCVVFAFGGSQDARLPRFVSGAVPRLPTGILTNGPNAAGEYGDIKVKLRSHDDGRLEAINVVSAQTALATLFKRQVDRWRVQGSSAEFDLTVRYLAKPGGCSLDQNPFIELIWPVTLNVYEPDFCGGGAIVDAEAEVRVAALRGVVVNIKGEPVVGALVHVGRQGFQRTLLSDHAGNFQANGLAVGSYRASVTVDGYQDKTFSLVIDKEAAAKVVTMTMRADTAQMQIPPAIVYSAGLVGYPPKAFADGRSGVVTMRLSVLKSKVIDIDADGNDEDLIEAARSNAETWDLSSASVPVLTVRYLFRVVQADCGTRPSVTVFMRLPTEVEVVARREVPCLAVPTRLSWPRELGQPAADIGLR